MNDFLEQHGYFLEKKDNSVIIHHKKDNYGCIHILFVFLFIPTIALCFLSLKVAFFLIPLFAVYVIEIERRKKHADTTAINYEKRKFEVITKKGKKKDEYFFDQATSAISTNEHIGGYASADKSTTEEYRKEINIFFLSGETLTLFSFVSDHEEEESEIKELVIWLEKVLKL